MVYLLHFKSPLKHAKHYLGFIDDINSSNVQMAGQGSKLMMAVAKAGIPFDIARTWPDADRNFERWLKNRKNTPELCPICSSKAMERGKVNKTLTMSNNSTEI